MYSLIIYSIFLIIPKPMVIKIVKISQINPTFVATLLMYCKFNSSDMVIAFELAFYLAFEVRTTSYIINNLLIINIP